MRAAAPCAAPCAAPWIGPALLGLALAGCNAADPGSPGPVVDAGGDGALDAGPRGPDPFADRVVSFMPGPNAGFGEDRLPGVVLGPPQGGGDSSGGLDVLSLGKQGCIVLQFTDIVAVDGAGPDLLVFENPFGNFVETGVVSVSADGVAWKEFPCAAADVANHFPGCAGTHYVYSSPQNGIPPTDPAAAGGDPFDLRDVGLDRAAFVRVCDSGANTYAGISGGFDLDAVAVVHGVMP